MFTGIVEGIAHIDEIRDANASRTFRVVLDGAFATRLADGESISVNGVCLTVERSGENWFEATAVEETLARTGRGV
jgi:riboflavin synthase